jgi:putative ABC transport system substrate-binding protein
VAGLNGAIVAIEYRWANNAYDRLPGLAADLVKRQVAVIVANSPSIAPAMAATTTIPITFLSGDDPVRLSDVAAELAPKRFELWKQAAPQLQRVARPWNAGDLAMSARYEATAAAAKTLNSS